MSNVGDDVFAVRYTKAEDSDEPLSLCGEAVFGLEEGCIIIEGGSVVGDKGGGHKDCEKHDSALSFVIRVPAGAMAAAGVP